MSSIFTSRKLRKLRNFAQTAKRFLVLTLKSDYYPKLFRAFNAAIFLHAKWKANVSDM